MLAQYFVQIEMGGIETYHDEPFFKNYVTLLLGLILPKLS